jgi:hypothetical protein
MIAIVTAAIAAASRLAPLAARVIPVTVKVATHPVTLQTAGGMLMVAGLRVASVQSRDYTLQKTAERLHRDTDVVGFLADERPLTTVRGRVKRNLVTAGQGIKEEARTYRLLITPPVHLWRYQRAKHTAKKFFEVSETHRLHDNLHHTDPVVAAAFGKDYPGEVKICKTYHRRERRYEKAMLKLLRVRTWYNTEVETPAQSYLGDVLERLKSQAVAHEIRADSVEDIYSRLLDEKVGIDHVDLNDPYDTGFALYNTIREAFSAEETVTVRNKVLRPWLARNLNLTDRQWKAITRAWDRAASPTNVVGKG